MDSTWILIAFTEYNNSLVHTVIIGALWILVSFIMIMSYLRKCFLELEPLVDINHNLQLSYNHELLGLSRSDGTEMCQQPSMC